MNTSNIDFELQAGQKVAQFSPLVEVFPTLNTPKDPDQNHQAFSITSSDIKAQIEAAISKDLCPSDKQKLHQTLLEFSDVFDESLGHTDVVQHRIDTGDSPPIRQYPWRLPCAYREEVKSQVNDMLKQGVVQHGHSPWASPIVLVKKRMARFASVLTTASSMGSQKGMHIHCLGLMTSWTHFMAPASLALLIYAQATGK